MKKALLLLVAFLSSLSFSACNGAAKVPFTTFPVLTEPPLLPMPSNMKIQFTFPAFTMSCTAIGTALSPCWKPNLTPTQ